MPFVSEKQRRKFYSLEEQGKLPKGTAARWESHTHSLDDAKALHSAAVERLAEVRRAKPEPQPDPKAEARSSQRAMRKTTETSPISTTSLTTGHSASIIAAVLAGRSVDPEG